MYLTTTLRLEEATARVRETFRATFAPLAHRHFSIISIIRSLNIQVVARIAARPFVCGIVVTKRPMPRPKDKGAPRFRGKEVKDFLEDFEECAEAAGYTCRLVKASVEQGILQGAGCGICRRGGLNVMRLD
ncbi:hypothetical protein K474DRAFT_1675155 [Panus rudis PR-1116 ss-1]|nr:hypothetical protein K474DRAFT_1675155 [Panus rudis PR-1116 ss-1]